MLFPLLLALVGAGTMSLVLSENILTVFSSLRAFMIPILAIFGTLGALGTYSELKYGKTYFSHLESVDGWKLSKRHIFRTGVTSICVLVFFAALWVSLWGVDRLLELSLILTIFGTGALLSLSITFVGATLAHIFSACVRTRQ